MCRWGTYEDIEVVIPAELSHTGNKRRKTVKVDACIASIVRALNEGGVRTISSCCGHGERSGSILLLDGRELVIKSDTVSL